MQHNSKTTSTLYVLASGAVLALAIGLWATNTSASDGGKWVAPASASSKKNPVAVNPASIQDGKKIYTKECVQCHGKSGKGDGPKASDLTQKPADLASSPVQSQTDGALFWKITTGHKPMPMFRTAYSDEDRWSIVNFLRTLRK